jgi:hypothetical protein
MELETINERLELYYGHEIDGRPRYRVVWSTGQLEKRAGTFNEFYGQIFLREFIGIKEVPKYPYDPDRWIIEKLFYLPNTEIIAEKPGSYEPIYVLKAGDGSYLPLNWKVIDMVVNFAEKKPVGLKLTDSDWDDQEQAQIEAETSYFEDKLEDEGRSNLFAFENSAFVDSTKVFGG